jgi:hypothetical protein
MVFRTFFDPDNRFHQYVRSVCENLSTGIFTITSEQIKEYGSFNLDLFEEDPYQYFRTDEFFDIIKEYIASEYLHEFRFIRNVIVSRRMLRIALRCLPRGFMTPNVQLAYVIPVASPFEPHFEPDSVASLFDEGRWGNAVETYVQVYDVSFSFNTNGWYSTEHSDFRNHPEPVIMRYRRSMITSELVPKRPRLH